jgi:hypothetical protein
MAKAQKQPHNSQELHTWEVYHQKVWMICSALLLSDFVKEKKKTTFLLLSDSYTGIFSCGTSMWICIIAQIGSSPLFFFFQP